MHDNVNDSNYISMSVYAISEELNGELELHCKHNTLGEFFSSLPQQPYHGDYTIGWYNHSKYRAVHYHFCSAITKLNMDKLNGFDERYALGVGFDDNELIVRIGRLGLKKSINDNISAIHQFHPYVCHKIQNAGEFLAKNRNLLNSVTKKEITYRAN